MEKLLCTSANTTFINPGRAKMPNAAQTSMAFKIYIIMCEAYKLLLETVIKVFHLDPFHAAGLYGGGFWPFLFGVPRVQSPLLQDETQYLKLTEPKEADHWFPLSLDTAAPPRWLALTSCLYFCKGHPLTRQPDGYNGPNCLRAAES